METRRLVRTDSPGRPPRLSHSSWTMQPLVRQPMILIVVGLYYVLVSCLSPIWFRPADYFTPSVGPRMSESSQCHSRVAYVVEINARRKTSNRFFGLPVFSGSVLSNLHGCFYILRLLFFPGLVLKPFSLSLVALFFQVQLFNLRVSHSSYPFRGFSVRVFSRLSLSSPWCRSFSLVFHRAPFRHLCKWHAIQIPV